MPEALPGVTVPSLAKDGFSLARSSVVTSGRMCSSVSTVCVPFLPFTSTGVICSLKYPAAAAAAARRWLSAASASWSSRETPKSWATFSAVTPMWQSSNGSVSAPTMASTTLPSCIRWPQRMAGSQYWPRLIDSAPPATATSQSPSLIACAADTIACSPVPHSRLRVKAGVSMPSPPSIAATRARYMSLTSVWITLPNITWPTSDGSTPARLTASRTTVAARSQGGTAARPPPYLPIGVRVPASTKTSRPLSITPPVGDRRSPAGDRRPPVEDRRPHAGDRRSHVHAAVDGPHLPGDVRGLVGRQEPGHPGDLLRLPEPAQRDLLAHPVQRLLGHVGHHVGGDVAGRDRVDGEPDPVAHRLAGPVELEDRLLGQRLREAEQPGLGGGVVDLADVAGLADHRGHVDDPAGAALEHVL